MLGGHKNNLIKELNQVDKKPDAITGKLNCPTYYNITHYGRQKPKAHLLVLHMYMGSRTAKKYSV